MKIFCDTNVLVAGCSEDHPQHVVARAVMERVQAGQDKRCRGCTIARRALCGADAVARLRLLPRWITSLGQLRDDGSPDPGALAALPLVAEVATAIYEPRAPKWPHRKVPAAPRADHQRPHEGHPWPILPRLPDQRQKSHQTMGLGLPFPPRPRCLLA